MSLYSDLFTQAWLAQKRNGAVVKTRIEPELEILKSTMIRLMS